MRPLAEVVVLLPISQEHRRTLFKDGRWLSSTQYLIVRSVLLLSECPDA